jgi:hypothetical protein
MAPDESPEPRAHRRSSLADSARTPTSLAELIERERIQLLQIHAMLRCLNDVLLYSDDDNSTMHADVANVAARLLDDSAARLELLRRLATQLATMVAESESSHGTEGVPPHQVREARPRYLC